MKRGTLSASDSFMSSYLFHARKYSNVKVCMSFSQPLNVWQSIRECLELNFLANAPFLGSSVFCSEDELLYSVWTVDGFFDFPKKERGRCIMQCNDDLSLHLWYWDTLITHLPIYHIFFYVSEMA